MGSDINETPKRHILASWRIGYQYRSSGATSARDEVTKKERKTNKPYSGKMGICPDQTTHVVGLKSNFAWG